MHSGLSGGKVDRDIEPAVSGFNFDHSLQDGNEHPAHRLHDLLESFSLHVERVLAAAL